MSPNDSRTPLPTLLDVERAISELRYAQAKLKDSDRWALERALSLERVLCWLELELGPLVAELGVPIASQASSTEVPPVEGIRRVLLERIATEPAPRRDFTPSDLGELGGHTRPPSTQESAGTVAPPARELAERLHELGEVTPEEGQAISARTVCVCGHWRSDHEDIGDDAGTLSCTCCACGRFRE